MSRSRGCRWRRGAKGRPQPSSRVCPAAASCKRSGSETQHEAEGVSDSAPTRALMSLFFKFRSNARGSATGGGMECGVAAAAAGGGYPASHPTPHPALSPTERSPAKSGLHVNFSDKGEVKERREKFLTAKYGSHQMALIRKRLAVEMWLYDELQKLYEVPREETARGGAGGGEVEVDIDELLDMDNDELRRAHLHTLLVDAKKPQKDVHKFINDLLEKAKTL